ncbi:MAG: DNA primase DnaG [Candidatus Nanohalobium sp.]
MGKASQKQAKYVIEADLEAETAIEKTDIIGAVFGQTEGLLNNDLDLRELKEKGKVGRMDIDVERNQGKTEASIEIPSSLNATDTALLAASLETIERVGPGHADIRVERIRDERRSKRDYIAKRAKQLLNDIEEEKPSKEEIVKEIREDVRKEQLDEYKGFVAGPEADRSKELIIVEGKADVKNLLKNGVRNALAIGGTSVPPDIVEIAEEKDLTAFLDGDRGGKLILKELKEKAKPRYVAEAPEGLEVEELSKKQIHEALRDKEPVKYSDAEPEEQGTDETDDQVLERLEGLVASRAAEVVDSDLEVEEKAPRDKVSKALKRADNPYAVLVDGEIDNSLISQAEDAGADIVAGMERAGNASSSKLKILVRGE